MVPVGIEYSRSNDEEVVIYYIYNIVTLNCLTVGSSNWKVRLRVGPRPHHPVGPTTEPKIIGETTLIGDKISFLGVESRIVESVRPCRVGFDRTAHTLHWWQNGFVPLSNQSGCANAAVTSFDPAALGFDISKLMDVGKKIE